MMTCFPVINEMYLKLKRGAFDIYNGRMEKYFSKYTSRHIFQSQQK